MPIIDSSGPKLIVALAADREREAIYRLRHDVYAVELGQHPVNQAERLTDALDESNIYITVSRDDLIGCISITCPRARSMSIEKYLTRAELPAHLNGGGIEIRLLTVRQSERGSLAAS